ncbi:MAG: ThiF family adenylyltransferase [Betaproteobacteria bacterium]|nr:ThiF family adenylyltransferase [Betaproteobacteria bacterium]
MNEVAVFSRLVVLTGDESTLNTANGQWCLVDSLRLLVRVVGRLAVILPPGSTRLETAIRDVCAKICFRAQPTIVCGDGRELLREATAVLHVGSIASASSTHTCVNSNGWVARVSSCGRVLPADVSQPNPIAALTAASLGVTEVFKRIVGVSGQSAPLLDLVEFSLFEMSTEFNGLGPELPEALVLPNGLLVGAGAIGNGVALLASQLPLTGRLHVIDKQEYGDENLGTCVLLETEGWIGHNKATRLASWLAANSGLSATGEHAFVKDALGDEKVRTLAPRVVLNGLDDVEARHDAQLAWPDLMIDGGISDVGAAVVEHRIDSRSLACLRCAFEVRGIDHKAIQEELTGLPASALSDQQRLLTEADVAAAAPAKQAWLKERLLERKTICSIVTEAGLKNLGVDAEKGFRPSVPFVATAAAALVFAALIKALQYPTREYAQSFTMGNLFLGPENSAVLNRPAKKSCLCVVSRSAIDALRRHRLSCT